MPALTPLLPGRAELIRAGTVLGPAALAGVYRVSVGGRELLAGSAAGALRTGARVYVGQSAGRVVVLGEEAEGGRVTTEVIIDG